MSDVVLIVVFVLIGAWEIDFLIRGAAGEPNGPGWRFHQFGDWLNRVFD